MTNSVAAVHDKFPTRFNSPTTSNWPIVERCLMGPMIILDKSVAQGLSKRATYELSRYFYINVTPILLQETLADLTVFAGNLDKSIKQVRDIAYKAMPMDSFPNTDYRTLCFGNLIGVEIPMKFVPVRNGGVPVKTPRGTGIYHPISAENEAIVRWQSGYFLEEDLKFAETWRQSLREFKFVAPVSKEKLKILKIRNTEDLLHFVTPYMTDPKNQVMLLQEMITLLKIPIQYRRQIWKQWILENHKSFFKFAPYAALCLRVFSLFFLGVHKGVFGNKPSNILDAEYLCYSPFCQIFATKDKFLKKFAPLILLPEQSLVGEDLMTELEDLAEKREHNPHTEPDEKSLIQTLWRKHLGKFSPRAQPRETPKWDVPGEVLVKEIQEAVKTVEHLIPPNKPFPHR